ncbi:GCN5 family acetyltransferase [Streptomyces hygroscopicus]|uniref:GNAT family N-acetyltransferase n=1 Tax=Streptomyces hygroscopicus TaxID=1912 RepID=UPI00223FCE79|nr:GNAT family protein [Streptomyces hygroscopicus]MCW7946469.1 GCN5 family acetyltransferase [Streptomyces hygroscopicus]
MIRGNKIGLRARHDADIPVLHAVLYNDVATRSRQDPRPWHPIPPGSARSPYAVAEPSDAAASFSVVELESQELVGAASLWGIDTHNRSAHLGISVLPDFRGRGFSSDIVRVLCEYGFALRGLQRLQVETMADNAPMIAAAKRAGFTIEATLRRSAWVYGAFVDQVILGLLAHEWTP